MSVTLGNLGTTSLVGTPSSTTVATKGLIAGSGIEFATSSTDVTITAATDSVCILSNSGSIAVNNGATSTLTWDTVELDPSSMNTTNQNITFLSQGIYLISMNVKWSTSASATNIAYATLQHSVHGAIAQQYVMPVGAASAIFISRLIHCAASEYVYVQATNLSGVNLSVVSNAITYSIFSAIKLSD